MINVTPQLIEKYHRGQCTADEREAVERWLTDEEMEAFGVPSLKRNDNELARLWSEMDSRLPQASEEKLLRPAKRRLFPIMLFFGAATVIAVILFGWPVALDQPSAPAQTYRVLDVPNGRKAQVTLADGTIVHLNSGSRLEYPAVFGDSTRVVKLMGEGFFAVAQDAYRPFVVDAGNTATEVLGTAFNLSAYPGEPHMLLVESGKVRFKVKNSEQHHRVVEAGRGVRWMESEPLVSIGHIPTDRFAWKAEQLVFNNHPLVEIGVRLERWYDVSVVIRRAELKNIKFTGSFKQAPLKTVMDDLAFVMQFDYRIKGKEVTIF